MRTRSGHGWAAVSVPARRRMANVAARTRAMPPRRPVLVASILGVVAFGPATAIAAEARISIDAGPGAVSEPARVAAPPTSRAALGLNEARLREMLAREAGRRGIPPALADAVAFVESNYRPEARGAVGELGLMQVRPQTAAMLGHAGPAEALLDPETNIRFGVAYLARAWTLAEGDLCRTLMKYRAGHGEQRMSALSVEYCSRARNRLAATGSPLSAAIPPETGDMVKRPAQSRTGRPGRQAIRAAIAGRLWAEHVLRVRAIEAKSDRIMRGG